MYDIKNIESFNKVFASILKNYNTVHRYYEKGDFGSLNQIVIESEDKGGTVEFWELGWLGINLVDYKSGKQPINLLLEPQQTKEKSVAFKKLKELLSS